MTAADADGDTLSYSLSGTDASSLSISSSGVISFNSAPDYETKTSYSITASVSDGSNAATKSITVNVTDVKDTYKLSGTAYASRYMVLDSDVPNTAWYSSSSNEYGSAQVVQNPVTIVGHTGNDTDEDGNNTTDSYDLYQLTLTNNMYVNLEVSEYEADVKDLDLYLFNTDGTAFTNWQYATGSREWDETIDLPSSGTILIQVNPVNGSSRYKLTIGQRVVPSSSIDYNNFKHTFIPNELIKIEPFDVKPDDNDLIKTTRTEELYVEVDARRPSGEVENNILLEFDIDRARQIQGIKDIDTKDERLVISEKQKEYLYHWRLIQKLESKYPEIDFGFNFSVFSTANFSKDPDYWRQWNFPAISAEAGLNAVGQETKDIVVAVLDTGSPPTNSAAWAATNFISGGIDFISMDTDPTDPDSFGAYTNPKTGRLANSHGTHVASTIGAKNNGADVNGFGIKVLPIKVLGDLVVGQGGSLDALINGINYASGILTYSNVSIPASEGPVKVINMSLGADYATSCPSTLQTAINNAVAQGITVVASAGNSALKNPGGSNWPALCDNVISVANVTQNFDRRLDSDYNSTVDIAAPGTDIYAWDKSNRIYALSGTSMAAPIVSGVIANMYSLDSGLTPAEINTYIVNDSFTYDLGSSGRDNEFGHGIIDFAKSANSVITGEGLTKSYAYVNPGLIDYGFNTTSINIELNKVGSSSLSVSGLSADNPTGLTYSSSVNSEGYGTYTLSLDRSNYPNGQFENVLYFNMSDGTSPAVGIRFGKGSLPNRADLGKVYIALVNSSGNLVASGDLDLDGSLVFETVGEVPIDDYWYVISTDIDNDGGICNSGEICEIYPTSDSSDYYISIVDADVTGDAVTLRAVPRGSDPSSSSSSTNSLNNTINKGYQIPLRSSKQNIQTLGKAQEVIINNDFSGTPVEQTIN